MRFASKEDRNRWHRDYRKKRRAELIEKLGGKCANCGETENLEFDHVDKDAKAFTIGDEWWRTDRVQELAKCQLLCAACHAIKTSAEGRHAEHGSHQMYDAYKCRCDQCRAFKCAYKKTWRASKKT